MNNYRDKGAFWLTGHAHAEIFSSKTQPTKIMKKRARLYGELIAFVRVRTFGWALLGGGFLTKALLRCASSEIKMQAFLLRSEACSREPLVLAQ